MSRRIWHWRRRRPWWAANAGSERVHRCVVRDDLGEVFLGLIPRIFLPLHLCPLLQIHYVLYLLLCHALDRWTFNIRCWRWLWARMLLHERLNRWWCRMHRADRWCLALRASRLRLKVLRDERRCSWWLMLRMMAEHLRLHPWWIASLWIARLCLHGFSGCTPRSVRLARGR